MAEESCSVNWVVYSHTEYTRNRDYVIAPSGQSANCICNFSYHECSVITPGVIICIDVRYGVIVRFKENFSRGVVILVPLSYNNNYLIVDRTIANVLLLSKRPQTITPTKRTSTNQNGMRPNDATPKTSTNKNVDKSIISHNEGNINCC